MKVFFSGIQTRHNPKCFFVNGTRLPNPEVPGRADALGKAARAAGHEIVQPEDHGLAPIAAVHTPEYLQFLSTIHARWQRIEGASEEVVPNIHPTHRNIRYPSSAVAHAGYHMTDTACPISANSWESIYWSANSAVSATAYVLETGETAYALCRPPGHHAFADLAGGFCFVNNSAVAAQRLRSVYERVAIIDVDLHHGNGTQGIFYHRPDVFTLSIHADPDRFYPFFWGHADERGAGRGLSYNLNLPIPRGSGDDAFLSTLDKGLQRVASFAPGAIVVALGLDAFEGDPFGGLAVTTPGFAKTAELIARCCTANGGPTVLVQEGGYLCPELGDNLVGFLAGFEQEARKRMPSKPRHETATTRP
ncbi:MAG: Acetylpolyamine amidohydrolase [Gammaproteobacteria bacterium]|nr:Acetylpolyamine amidohydrolase [Gammaproteobacteria bacterium]